MNLPLSQEDKQEISDAYKKAVAEINASAASLEALTEALEQRMACLAPGLRGELQGSLDTVGSSLFKLQVFRVRVQNANLDGREFSALDANSPAL